MEIEERLELQTGKRLDSHVEPAPCDGDGPRLISRIENGKFELVFHAGHGSRAIADCRLG
jgi:hypothetical protein